MCEQHSTPNPFHTPIDKETKMKYLRFEYEDPTGGGDNAVLLVPEWAEDVQPTLAVGNDDGETFIFDYINDADNGEEVEAPEIKL